MSLKHKKVPTQTTIGTLKRDAQPNSLASINLIRMLKAPQRVRIKSPATKEGPKSHFMQVVDEILVNGKSVQSSSPSRTGTIQITVDNSAHGNDLIYLVESKRAAGAMGIG